MFVIAHNNIIVALSNDVQENLPNAAIYDIHSLYLFLYKNNNLEHTIRNNINILQTKMLLLLRFLQR